MSNLRVFTLPAGTRLQSDCMGDTLRADVVMVEELDLHEVCHA